LPAPYPDSFYKLSNEEAKLMDDKYDFIERTGYIWNKKLKGLIDVDDIIQICAIGFIKAIRLYDEKRGHFEVYAKMKMNSEVSHYMTCNKNRFTEMSLDDTNTVIRHEYIDKDDEIINNIQEKNIKEYKNKLLKYIKSEFSDRDIKIIKQYLNEVPQIKLAEKFNVSRQRIGQIITKFRKLAKIKIDEDKLLIS